MDVQKIRRAFGSINEKKWKLINNLDEWILYHVFQHLEHMREHMIG